MANKKNALTFSLKRQRIRWYTRWESNPYRRNRNPVFYPLNYGCLSLKRCKNTQNLFPYLTFRQKFHQTTIMRQ